MKAIASQSNLILQYDKRPRVLKSFYTLSSGAKDVYTYLYNIFTNSTTLKVDNEGQYLTVSRKAISKAIGRSIKTVIGYIVELVKVGLIRDRRIGVKEVNRIYFYDVEDKYKYDKSPEDESSESETPNTQTKYKELINQVKEIVSPLESVSDRRAKRILTMCKNDISLLSSVVEYVSGKEYKDLLPYMSTVIRNGYYKSDPPKPKKTAPQTQGNGNNNRQYTPKKKKSSFYVMHEREYEEDYLNEAENLYNEYQFKEITEEEYKKKYLELQLKFGKITQDIYDEEVEALG